MFLLAFTAWSQGYGSSCWLTFNQAKDKGGSFRKGEKSSLVVFWKQHELEDKQTGKPKTVPVLRYYRVFNAEQDEKLVMQTAGAGQKAADRMLGARMADSEANISVLPVSSTHRRMEPFSVRILHTRDDHVLPIRSPGCIESGDMFCP